MSSLLTLAGVGLCAGILIGCIGIGGVLLVPALNVIGGVEVHRAIAACMFSYAFSGSLGAALYARRGSIRWSSGLWLCLGAMPGAYLGALTVSLLPADTIKLIIALFIVFAGVHAMRDPTTAAGKALSDVAPWLLLIGLITGFGSAITGTGGPLLLVPLLVWLNYPVLTAVGLSQVIQLPISTLATLGNAVHGQVDFSLGLGIAATLIIGVAVGARLAHRLPAAQLRRVVAVVLVALGAWMTWQTGQTLLINKL